MSENNRTKRRLLGVSVGIAAFTAVEGLACGNPVEPRGPKNDVSPETASTIDAGLEVSTVPADDASK